MVRKRGTEVASPALNLTSSLPWGQEAADSAWWAVKTLLWMERQPGHGHMQFLVSVRGEEAMSVQGSGKYPPSSPWAWCVARGLLALSNMGFYDISFTVGVHINHLSQTGWSQQWFAAWGSYLSGDSSVSYRNRRLSAEAILGVDFPVI